MNSHRQRSSHSLGVTALAIYLLIVNIEQSESYETSTYSLGCYPYPQNHSFTYQPPRPRSTVQINQCRTDCNLYEYAALWAGAHCSCFDEMPSSEESPSACTTTCNGDGGQYCGSDTHMSLYNSRIGDERIPSNITVTDSVTGKSDDPLNMTSWRTHSAIVYADVVSPPDPTTVIQFSDGSDSPIEIAAYDSNDGTHTFSLLRSRHEYELVATVTDNTDLSTLQASLVIKANLLNLQNLSIFCPQYAASTKEMECLISALGNNMMLDLDFGDGTLKNMNLGDSSIELVGSINDFGLTYGTSVVANEIYFLPNFLFKRAGKLVGFKFHAGQSDTQVTIRIYRPVCSEVTTPYCYHSDNCLNVNETCDGTLDSRSAACNSEHVWSFSMRRCVDSNGVEQYNNNRLITDLGGDSFEMVHSFVPTVTKTGWQSHVDSALFTVEPGDMVGLETNSASGHISYINRNLGTRMYRGVITDPTVLPSLSTTGTIDFLLEAYVAKHVDVIVKKTYPDEVDAANVSVSLTSPDDPYNVFTDYSSIDVQVEISGVQLVTNYSDVCDGANIGGSTNYSHPFHVPPHPGELPRYTIRWGDGTYRLKTFSPEFNHTYLEGGVYNVTVFAENAVSNQFNMTTVAIQDEILNLQLTKDYHVTALDNQSTLYIWVDQGTNVTYTITIYDQTGTVYVLRHHDDNTYVPGEHLGYNAYVNYTFGAPGNWTMRVVAENCISRMEATLWFKVEVPIIGLDIIEIAPIAFGNSTIVYFSIINGTDITFYSNFDGIPTREWVMHEAGIIGHQYNDVNVLKVTLIYNLMHEWLAAGRIGPPPVSVAEAEEFGLGSMVADLAALGQSSLEMLAGPMEPMMNEDSNSTNTSPNNETDTAALLADLEELGLSMREKAKVRCSRDLDGCSWHHGMAFITPFDYNVTGPHVLELFAENIVQEAFVNVSTTVWVEYIIEDLVMLANETFVKTGDVILYNVTVSQLSRANTTIYYGDSHEDMEWRYEMLENDTIEFYHWFNESGNYTVEVHSINNISEAGDSVNMTIQDPVTAVYLVTNSPVTRPWIRGGIAEFKIFWNPAEALLASDSFLWISYGTPDGDVTDEYFSVGDVLHNVTVARHKVFALSEDWLMQLVKDEDGPLIIENNDDNEIEILEVSAYMSLTTFEYWDFGDYNVSINLSNLVSYETWDMVLVVDQEVLDLAIVSDIYNLTFGFEAKLNVSRRWGSRVNFTWDYEDSQPNEWAMFKPDEENYMIHQYNEVGVYWVTVTAVNSVGTWKAMLPEPIMVQHPIIGFSLECEYEMVLLEYPEWATYVETFLMLDKSYPLATNVTAVFTMDIEDKDIVPVTIDINTAYAACDKSRETSTHYHILTIGHTYALGARRKLGVEMSNLVSNGTYNDTLDVYEDIYNLTLAVKSVIAEEDAADPSQRHIGFGSGADKFPLDHFMVVEIDMFRGSFINYTWTFGDGHSLETYESDFITHKYEFVVNVVYEKHKPTGCVNMDDITGVNVSTFTPVMSSIFTHPVGWYTITMNASNPLSAAYYEIRFQMQRGVGPVSVYTETPLTRNTSIDLVIDPGWIGTDACYFVDFGAVHYLDDMHHMYFFGDQAYCASQWFAKQAEFPNYRYDWGYDEAQAWLDFQDGDATFSIEFNYLFVGIYTASIIAMNEVSSSNHSLYIGVTRGPCQWPLVDMKINNPCLVDTLCTDFQGQRIKQHYRSESLEVKAVIFINCSSTEIYHHTWVLDEVHHDTGEFIRTVDNADLANSRGEIPDFYSTESIPGVLLPKNVLTYGVYRFCLNVSMDGEIGIETTDCVFIEIVKSGLKASIVGGESRRKGWSTNVTFDALSESYDPDYPDYKDDFKCRWLCKRASESWPIYNDDYTVELIPYQITNQTTVYYPDDTGGCFRDGYNSSGFFDIHPEMVDPTGCLFTYDFFYAYENDRVEFKVIIEKDTRKKILQTFVEITEGDPPEIDITSESACLSNCEEKVNYAAKYTIEASVTNGRMGTVYNYEWDLFEADGIGDDINPFVAHQFGHPLKETARHNVHECGELEGMSPEVQETFRPTHGRYIDFCRAASTGVNRQAITIESDLFTADDSVNTYYLYVKIYRPGSLNYGETYRKFFINKPPIAGECATDPLNGTALVSKFNVHCDTPFEDEHKPFNYEITTAGSSCCQNDPSSIPSWKYFHKGSNPYSNEGGLLSQGEENNQYKKWLRVRCFDSIGSWTDIYIQTIIMPAPPEVVAEQARQMRGEDGNALLSNPDNAANVMGAVGSTMNKPASNCTECDFAIMYVLMEEIVDLTDPKYGTLDEQVLAAYQHCELAYTDCHMEEMLERAATREAMLLKFAKINPNTVAGCEAKTAAMVSIAGNPDELSADAQDLLSSQTGSCVKLFANTEEKVAPTQALSIASNVMEGSGAAIQAASKSIEAEAEEEASIASQSSAHAELRRRRRKRSSGKTAEETQLELLQNVDSVGGVLGGSKAAGESPSVLETPTMNLAVNKAWGDKASNVPADDGNGFNLPDAGNMFPDANDTSQLVMSSQVISQPKNPFVGKNATDNNTLTINSAVVMLSLTNSSGQAIEMGNVSQPTHIFIKRDAADVTVNTLVNTAGEYLNTDDKTPFVMHKVIVPAASSFHVRIVQTWVFNTTNCTGLNFTVADNETIAYCNWTSTLESTPQPTWLDATTAKPATTTTTRQTTTTTRQTTTAAGSTTTSESITTTTADPTTTHVDFGNQTTTHLGDFVTPDWIVEETNKTGFVLYIGIGAKPSLSRPESYVLCELPTLNDPIKLLQREIRLNNVNKQNVSDVMNGTDIPDWVWNLPDKLENDLDTCFFSNSYFDSAVESELYIGVKYIAPTNDSSNITDWLSTTTPAPVRKRRGAATTASPLETTTIGSMMEEMVEQLFYQMEFYTAQCKIWNHYIMDWETSGCEVGPYSSPTNTHCICTKLTRDPPEGWVEPAPNYDPISGEIIPPASAPPMSFGAALAVPTNTIDMSGAAFANLNENPLVFSLMVSMMCLYLCLLIWARAADVKDEIKASTSPLMDNDPRDKYFYELIVYTGSSGSAATTAKVSAIFSGDEDETTPRLIFDDKKPVLTRGGIDSFIMGVPQSLGSLNVLRLWHDNSGKDPSWQFSRMQVTDLQTNEKFFFVCDRWLAVDQDDGCIDRVIPVAGKEELTNFNLIFWSKAKKDITDGHIWFSVFGRPHRSRFTRIQRLTCCLSLLFCTMFANIYFYKADDSGPPAAGIRLGPIEFTLPQLLTGIYASLIVFPVNLFVVMIFKYSGQRQKSLPKAVKLQKQEDQRALTQSTLELRQQAEYLNTGNDNNRLLTGLDTTAVDDIADMAGDGSKKKKGKFMLPWWFIFVGYLFCLGSVGWSFYAVVSVAFTFGPTKAQEWVISFSMSFFESVFFTQPLKVLGLAAFYALVIKSPAVEDEDERDPELQKDEVYIHQHKHGSSMSNPTFRRRMKRFTKIPLPPSEEYLKAARALRQKEVKMMDILKEIVVYLGFIYLLLMVGYGNRDPWAHYFYKNVKNMAAHGHWAPGNSGYAMSNVKDYATFYRWLENTLLTSYYSTEVYDGERHWWTTNFSSDYNSVPVGRPRLRLLRTKDVQCPMPVYRYSRSCGIDYSIGKQDEDGYKAGWVPLNASDPALAEPDEGFFYNTSKSLNGFVTSGSQAMYSGGGYIYELSHIQNQAIQKVNYLKQIDWLNPQTRAVFVEFNLYNSAINLFAVSYILFEFMPTGSVEPSFKLQIFRLDRYVGSQALTVMIAEILTTIFFIFYLVREVKAMRRLKKDYFKSAWNIFEISVLGGCLFSLVLYCARLYICLTTMKRFREDKTAFHNFQMAAGIDELYGFCMSFILFAATIKFTKLLRFNKRIMTLAISMIAILKPLASFGLVFGITFIAFAQMAYMIFCNNLLEFSTLLASSETLFSMMLNKFDYPTLERANPLFAPIMFLAFVLMMTFSLLNFMLTIILDTYTEIKDELMQQENEYQIVEFITNKMKGLVGMAPPPNLPKMRSENAGFVDDKEEELSTRVEELMEKFMDIVMSDPQQKAILDDYEQKKKLLRKGGNGRRIVTG